MRVTITSARAWTASARTVAVTRVVGHRLDESAVAALLGFGEGGAHGGEEAPHPPVGHPEAVEQGPLDLLQDVAAPARLVEAGLGRAEERVAQIEGHQHAGVEDGDGAPEGGHRLPADAAIDTVLQAYASVLTKSPRKDHRHRIEHCSLLHDDQLQKMRALGLSPSFLIGHVHYWGRAFRDRILGPQRANLLDPCCSALEADLRITFHSDYNVTPVAPLQFVETAVTRDAAWQCRQDDITGSIEPGKRVDFAVLEQDPTAVDPTTITSIKVVETWLDGYQRYTA